jgi:hypothetical protein
MYKFNENSNTSKNKYNFPILNFVHFRYAVWDSLCAYGSTDRWQDRQSDFNGRCAEMPKKQTKIRQKDKKKDRNESSID